ncbi:PP2C family protein-serine/threonine phosphatase [Rhodoflexus caldus]|uniref:PP2C family protein-serine/threonine phosphatase n=1 Tax=Rhodoflexus caldus TaxID=2891236 RepID=UPI00202A9CD6|nr:SpoIIE family protein phosphatase [Rhodoflexus caldus]
MKSLNKFIIVVFCYLFLFVFHSGQSGAQGNKTRLFSGQVVNTDNQPVKGVKVFFEGFNNIVDETDGNGNFELPMPASFAVLGQTAVYVGNKKIERGGYAYNAAANTLIIKLKEELPEGVVQLIEFFDERSLPLPAQVAVTIKGKKFRTNEKGCVEFNSPPYFKADELDSEPISVEGYEVSSTYYTAANRRFFVYLKGAKPSTVAKQETTQPQPTTGSKPEEKLLPSTEKADSEIIRQDFTNVLNELEMEKQFLNERSIKIRDEIEKIASQLGNQQLSDEAKQELRKYLNRLEKQLIENDLAYESAQEKIKQVIERMRLEVMSKDSINAAAVQKIETIAAEKEAAVKEKEAIEALYRARLLIIALVALGLAGAAVASYSVSQKLKKQKEEIIGQRNSIEEKNKNLEKAYLEIQSQKTEIERQNHQITTSIRYAESIQNAILPLASTFKEAFKDYFVYYQPKDIVSGDFYWCYSDGNKTLIAVVDCTGHGVPGAFMSLIGYNLLNEQVKQHGFSKPSQILDGLDKNLRIVLRQEQKVNNDSMDVGICLIEGHDVCFAGAKRALLIYRAQTDTLEEIRGDRKPIGGFKKDLNHHYQDHHITVNAGDSLYLFTDGITDQPNPSLDKFGYQQLKQVISAYGHMSMEHQKEGLEKALHEHRKGAPLRDDMTVLAVRIG